MTQNERAAGPEKVPSDDIQALADRVVIANATGDENLFLQAVRDLLACVRALRGQPAAIARR